MKKCLLLLSILAMSSFTFAQTPGLITKTAGTGAAILNPDGDGYISQKTNGTQQGFTNPPNSDLIQSEIPYAPILKIDPSSDIMQGGNCGFSDLVGDINTSVYPALGYYDAAHQDLLFRLRLASSVPNNKGYSILIDTDQKFGFTGANADPNAVPGNPGFEIEIAAITKASIGIYNVDGTTTPTAVFTNSDVNFSQLAIALSRFCSQTNYFYDFFVPIAQLTTIPGLPISTSTPLRFVITSNMQPKPSIGSNAISDIGGETDDRNIDDQYIDLIDGQNPTPIDSLNGGVFDITRCPPINSVYTASLEIIGNTTEVDGTLITVTVYASNGTTVLATGTTYSVDHTWVIPVENLSPAITLQSGQIVKAKAKAPGKRTSVDNCDTEVIRICTGQTAVPTSSEISKITNGFKITVNRPVGTLVYMYTTDYNLRTVSDLQYSILNPYTTRSNPETFYFECNSAGCLDNHVYIFRMEEPDKCISNDYVACDFSGSTASSTPSISTNPVTTSTTSISGNGNSANAQIIVYINGIHETTVTTSGSSPYAYTANISGQALGDVISVKQIESGKCISNAASLSVTRQAFPPVITSSSCNPSATITNIAGTSVEVAGTEITVYKLNPTRSTLGTTLVVTGGTWNLTSLSLTSGDQITAAVTAGTNLTTSVDANIITLSLQTLITDYTISINQVKEGDTSIGGNISGGSYPVLLNIYVDGNKIASGTVNAGGAWTISGLNATLITPGSRVNISLTKPAYCESAFSATSSIIQCIAPVAVSISITDPSICINDFAQIIVQNSEPNVIYTPVLTYGGATFGVSGVGNGGSITLTTYPISDTVSIRVKAQKISPITCETLSANSLSLTTKPRPENPTATSPQPFCGNASVSELVVQLPSNTTLRWHDSQYDGNILTGAESLVSGTTYYAAAVSNSNGCESASRADVTAEAGNPLAPVAVSPQSLCTHTTVGELNASLVGPGSLKWFTTQSGGSPLGLNIGLVDGATYYAASVDNICESLTRTPVVVNLNLAPVPTRWLGVTNDWNDPQNWDPELPSVCSQAIIPAIGGNVMYPVITDSVRFNTISFEAGAAALGLQFVDYEKAFVGMDLRRLVWYTLTPPLKNMFSGDFYFNGNPRVLMRLFNDGEPTINSTVDAVGTWSKTFSSLSVPLDPGKGFAFYVDTFSFHYPNAATYDNTDLGLDFPKLNPDGSLVDEAVPYSVLNGKPYPALTQYMPKDSSIAFRFSAENAMNVLSDVKVPIIKGLNLIGNPIMTHLDFNRMYAHNMDKISNKVRFWNGTTFTTFMYGYGIMSDMNLNHTSIPPMQSFFVEGLHANDTLTIDIDQDFITDQVTQLRTTNPQPKVLYVRASRGIYTTCTAIAMNENASNNYGNDDAYKLFTSIDEVADVYTLADWYAVDINQFKSVPFMAPVGIRSAIAGTVKLDFIGAQNFEGINVNLINSNTGEMQDLKTNSTYNYDYDGKTSNGSLFVEFRDANTRTKNAESDVCNKCVQVYTDNNNSIVVNSAVGDNIKAITIWEQDGKQLYNSRNINSSNFEFKADSGSPICVVRITTESRVIVTKVIMK